MLGGLNLAQDFEFGQRMAVNQVTSTILHLQS
jgi:hypothetical protein